MARRSKPIDEANVPFAKRPQSVCHGTLLWLISFSLGLVHATTAIALSFFVLAGSLKAGQPITRKQLRRIILEDYALHDCAGYLRTHSSFYRRTFERALDGDIRALHRVFRDPQFHSGDKEAWCSIPGAILYVVGDQRFAEFLTSLSPAERPWAVPCIAAAEPFDFEHPRRGLQLLRRD